MRYFWSIIDASQILGIFSGDKKSIKVFILPVECLKNRIMEIIKGAVLRGLNYSIQLWYAYYRNSERVYSHSLIPILSCLLGRPFLPILIAGIDYEIWKKFPILPNFGKINKNCTCLQFVRNGKDVDYLPEIILFLGNFSFGIFFAY